MCCCFECNSDRNRKSVVLPYLMTKYNYRRKLTLTRILSNKTSLNTFRFLTKNTSSIGFVWIFRFTKTYANLPKIGAKAQVGFRGIIRFTIKSMQVLWEFLDSQKYTHIWVKIVRKSTIVGFGKIFRFTKKYAYPPQNRLQRHYSSIDFFRPGLKLPKEWLTYLGN